jgi:hypothetical protein
MSTQVQPEPVQAPQEPQIPQEILSQPIQAGPTQEEFDRIRKQNEFYAQQVAAMQYQQQLQLQTQQQQHIQQQPQQPVPQQSWDDFQQNPAEFIGRIIQSSIAPLAQSVAQTQRIQIIDQIVQQAKSAPQFADVKLFEPQFRALLGSFQNLDLGSVQAAYYSAKGQFVSNGGVLEPQTQTQVTQQQPQRPNHIPPHLIPSGPVTIPQHGGLPALRKLTENEERLRSEQRMSHHKFLFMLGGPEGIDRKTFEAHEAASKQGRK